jgi:hypothetical protein
VIKSEFIWIWIPSITVVLVAYGVKKYLRIAPGKESAESAG